MPRLHIQTLGGFHLWRDDEPVPPLVRKTQKTRALFAILLQYYYARGDRVAALAMFDRCRQTLADELGVEPLAHTLDLRDAILHNTLDLTQPHPSMLPGVVGAFPALASRRSLKRLLQTGGRQCPSS